MRKTTKVDRKALNMEYFHRNTELNFVSHNKIMNFKEGFIGLDSSI